MREKHRAFVASLCAFSLSVWVTFTHKFQILTQNYTPLSIDVLTSNKKYRT